MHTWKQNLLLRISPNTCLQLKKHDAFQGSLGYQCEKRLNNGTSFQRILYVCPVNEDSYKEHSDLLVLVSSCQIFSIKILINLCGTKFYSYLWILKKVRKSSQAESWTFKWYIYWCFMEITTGHAVVFCCMVQDWLWLGQSKILIRVKYQKRYLNLQKVPDAFSWLIYVPLKYFVWIDLANHHDHSTKVFTKLKGVTSILTR